MDDKTKELLREFEDRVSARYPTWKADGAWAKVLTREDVCNVVDDCMARETIWTFKREQLGNTVRYIISDGHTEIGRLIITSSGELEKDPSIWREAARLSIREHGDLDHIFPLLGKMDERFYSLCQTIEGDLFRLEVQWTRERVKMLTRNPEQPTPTDPPTDPAQSKKPMPTAQSGRPSHEEDIWAIQELRNGRPKNEVYLEWLEKSKHRGLTDPQDSFKKNVTRKLREEREERE